MVSSQTFCEFKPNANELFPAFSPDKEKTKNCATFFKFGQSFDGLYYLIQLQSFSVYNICIIFEWMNEWMNKFILREFQVYIRKLNIIFTKKVRRNR